MGRMKLLLVSALLIGLSFARVELENAAIYDEYDVHSDIYVQFCDTGCRVYVSIPESSKAITKNIFIYDYKKYTSINDVAVMQLSDGQKGYFNVPTGTDQFDIINKNEDGEFAPVLIYVVRVTADHAFDAEIYEASYYNRSASNTRVITLISAEPYTLSSTAYGASSTMTARTVGFDSVNDNNVDKCTDVLKKDLSTDPTFTVYVNTPLFSMLFSKNTNVSQTAFVGNPGTLDLAQAGFFSSPGYLGCYIPYGQETYRSSLYPTQVFIAAETSELQHVTMTTELNIASENPIHLTDEYSEKTKEISGDTQHSNKEQTIKMDTNGLELLWILDTEKNFLIRYTVVPVNPVTTQAPTTTTTTTSAPSTVAPKTCGRTPNSPNVNTGNAVVGGTEAVANSWPWTVVVCKNDWFGNCEFQCAGTLIATNWVLTSASCVYNAGKATDWNIVAGVHNQTISTGTEQKLKVQAIYLNPGYSDVTNRDNIALLHLSSNAFYTPNIQPACLPLDDSPIEVNGTSAWFVGWGYTTGNQIGSVTSTLHQAYLPIDAISVCQSIYFGNGVNPNSEICAGDAKKTACNYDIGGPLQIQAPTGEWNVYGLSSYVSTVCDQPAVFTRVSAFCGFIKQFSGVECV